MAVTVTGPLAIGQDDLRNREGDIDRVDLVDRGQRTRGGIVAGAHDRAGLAGNRPDATRNRSANLGEGKRCLDAGLGRLVGFELCFGGFQGGTGIVALHHSAGILRQEFLEALQVAPGLRDLSLVLADLGVDLAELRPEGTPIEFEENIALLHEGTLLDIHLHDLAVHPRLDLDGCDGLHRADGIDLHRHGLADDRHDDDRNRTAGVEPAAPPLGLRAGGGARLTFGRLGGRIHSHAQIRARQPDDINAVDVGGSTDRNRDQGENSRTDESHCLDSQDPKPR